MKPLFLMFAILAFIVSTCCNKSQEPITEITIPVNGCTNFQYQSDNITCCLDSVISDSRCPADATCIWQGMAIARYKVSNKTETHFITLATLTNGSFVTDTVLMGYKFSFVKLLPYPKSGPVTNYKDYVATLKITKQ